MIGRRIKVGIVGCGAIGSELAHYILKELKHSYYLTALCDRDVKKAEHLLSSLSSSVQILSIEKLIKSCDMVIESASISAAHDLITRMAKVRKRLVILSVGVFVKYPRLLSSINKGGLTLYVPSGAIAGVDGISSLALEEIKSITLLTSKPPSSLRDIPFLKRKRIDVSRIRRPTKVFEGNIKKAIKYFPKNINVAAIIFLASRFRKIKVVIKVDPFLKRNTHRIEVNAVGGRLYVEIENFPSSLNPRTSRMAILSTKNLLKKITSSIKVGS